MARRSQEDQPKSQPRSLPRDLYTESLGRDIKGDLEQFRNGEVERKEVIRRTADRINTVMNSIATKMGYDPNAQRLTKKNQPATIKDTCSTWFKKLGGTYWTVEKNLPEDARVPWADYCHFKNNPSPTSETYKAQAAKDFTTATGFDPEEVFKFQCSLNKKKP
ncbi:MAG: hypothetical protein AAB953_00480 [Patescibacteria group bacterium]